MQKDLTISLPLQISTLAQGLVFAGVSILSFFMPFALGHPQWLVGTIVNACLFLGAVYLPKRYYISLAILPSLGVLARGALFGPMTMFLVYFLPFIWLGNLILIILFKKIFSGETANLDDLKFGLSVFLASAVKFLGLWIVVNIYFSLSIVPKLFISSMSLNQLATALAGGLIAFLIFKLHGQFNARSHRP
jgi:hypothetical protein